MTGYGWHWKKFLPVSESSVVEFGGRDHLNASLIAVASLVLSFLVAFYLLSRSGKLQLPPGPFNWPVVGSSLHLGVEPHRSLEKLAHKYGPLMHMRLGCRSAIVVSNAEMANQVLRVHDAQFGSRPPLMMAEYVAGGITLAPTTHLLKLKRRIITLEILGPSRLKAFRGIREEEVAALVKLLWPTASTSNRPVELRPLIYDFTLRTLCRTVLGEQSCDPTGRVAANRRFMIKSMTSFNEIAGKFNIGDLIPWVRWLDLQGLKKQYEYLRKQEDKVFNDILEERNQKELNGTNHEPSFLDVLLKLQGESKLPEYDIARLVWEMLGAGTDTTATVVEWCLAYVICYPHVLAIAQEEVDRVVSKNRRVEEADAQNLPYILAVVKETLRLQPPVVLGIPHYNEDEAVVAGYKIPAKSQVIVNQRAVMRDPYSWESPLEFKPERFLGHETAIGQDFRFVPFGGGRRGCPGIGLATTVMTLALASLLHAFDWKLPAGQVPEDVDLRETFGLTVRMRKPLVAVPTPRIHKNVYSPEPL